MRQISNPARSSGVATAKIPKGAVASELANDGKKKTILRDLDNGFSSLKENDRYSPERSCHRNVSNLSGVCCDERTKTNNAPFPGRVPHVRQTCPGVPWGVRGPKKMGATQRSLFISVPQRLGCPATAEGQQVPPQVKRQSRSFSRDVGCHRPTLPTLNHPDGLASTARSHDDC